MTLKLLKITIKKKEINKDEDSKNTTNKKNQTDFQKIHWKQQQKGKTKLKHMLEMFTKTFLLQLILYKVNLP